MQSRTAEVMCLAALPWAFSKKIQIVQNGRNLGVDERELCAR